MPLNHGQVASLCDSMKTLCDAVAALKPRVDAYCDSMARRDDHRVLGGVQIQPTAEQIRNTLGLRFDASKDVMLANEDRDFGLVPEGRANAEAKKLAKEFGKTVYVRDPVTDKVLRKVTARDDSEYFGNKEAAIAEAKKQREAGKDVKVIQRTFINPRTGHEDSHFEVVPK